MSKCFISIRNFFFTVLLSLCFINASHAATLFQDNFNYSDSPNNHGWSTGPTSSIASGAGPDGSNALKILFNCDSNTCGDRWHNWSPPANTSELWVKFNFKMDCGSGNCIGGGKFFRVVGQMDANGNRSGSTYQLEYGTSLFTGVQYGCSGEARDIGTILRYGSTNSWDFDCSGPNPIKTNLYGTDINAKNAQWHTFKYHLKYNDNDQNNGIFEVWYDGVYAVKATGVNNRSNNNIKAVDYIILGGWNQSYGGVPYSIYYDNFIASDTDPDGNNGSTTIPAVTNLKLLSTSK